jgi:hypothetical protein
MIRAMAERERLRRALTILAIAALAGLLAEPAFAGWRLSRVSRIPIAYNQGITFDPASRSFLFSGATGALNSGLFRASMSLRPIRARDPLVPTTKEGYNHVGDLSFDPVGRRVLLPLECYDPYSRANPCGSGAVGVADPLSLAFRYYVNLHTSQVRKAMWVELSPDARWVWTSSARRLLAYRAADVNRATAVRQRAGTASGIVAKDLGVLLPTSGVTGAAFSRHPATGAQRLFLALNRRTYHQIISYPVGVAPDGSPSIAAAPRPELSVTRSGLHDESEGLAVTAPVSGAPPLGGVLHWQMLPHRGLNARVLSYVPSEGRSQGRMARLAAGSYSAR